MKHRCLLLAALMLASSASAQTVRGSVEIVRRLSRHSVTPAIPLYQRGPTVKLGSTPDEDPLAYERSHVVVYLESPAPPSPPAHPIVFTMQQQNRQFVPDLLAVPAGSQVSFPNLDPIFHNVFSLSKPKSFDLGSYDKGDTREVTFNKPGPVTLYCHLHPNMAAVVFVTPNRFYARSDRLGHFEIQGIPPGHYILAAWHKSAGTFRQPITVEATRDLSVTFVIPITDPGPSQAAPAKARP